MTSSDCLHCDRREVSLPLVGSCLSAHATPSHRHRMIFVDLSRRMHFPSEGRDDECRLGSSKLNSQAIYT